MLDKCIEIVLYVRDEKEQQVWSARIPATLVHIPILHHVPGNTGYEGTSL